MRWRLFFALLLLAVCGEFNLGAHNPDTSYARITIESDAVEFRFTYDVATLLRMTPLDEDGDRTISREELSRGVPAIHEFLNRHIWIELNGGEASIGDPAGFVWPPEVGDAITEKDYHSAAGLVHLSFRLPVEETPENVVIDFRFFDRLGDRHLVLGSFVYEERPHEVSFSLFEPDYDYVTGYETPLWKRLTQFFRLGVRHIFSGYDHICFLLALVVVSRWKELVWIVTAFTAAHSITLILAVLVFQSLPVRLIEISIAATIVYVALENLRTKPPRHRWILAFVFGLIHGFGFANVLREMELPDAGLVRCLLAFNLGVEAGQLAIVLALVPLTVWIARWRHGRRVVVGVSVALAVFGAGWLLDRVFSLAIMPF